MSEGFIRGVALIGRVGRERGRGEGHRLGGGDVA